MQKILLLFALTIIFVQNNRAQWIPQIRGTTNGLADVYYVGGGTGWAVGSFGIILDMNSAEAGANYLMTFEYYSSDNQIIYGRAGIISKK